MNAKVNHAGYEYDLSVTDGIYHASGEFEGNVDMTLRSTPPVPESALVGGLGVARPGVDEFVPLLGSGEVGGGIGLTFYIPARAEDKPISAVHLLWREGSQTTDLGKLDCRVKP